MGSLEYFPLEAKKEMDGVTRSLSFTSTNEEQAIINLVLSFDPLPDREEEVYAVEVNIETPTATSAVRLVSPDRESLINVLETESGAASCIHAALALRRQGLSEGPIIIEGASQK